MSPIGPRSELIYLVSMGYEGRIDSRFTFVHKSILVITQGVHFWLLCTEVSEQSLKIELID